MSPSTRRRLVVAGLVAGPVLANAGFLLLGVVFDYPAVLRHPPSDVLDEYLRVQPAVMLGFGMLCVGAAILAPVAIGLRRLGLDAGVTGRGASLLDASAWVGVAAAAVQVVGLSRWLLVVPALATAGDTSLFAALGFWLGTVVGEAIGYVLTVAWTVLVVVAFGAGRLGRFAVGLGLASAALILVGVAEPWGVPLAGLSNLVGYILWSVWLVALAVRVARHPAMRPMSRSTLDG